MSTLSDSLDHNRYLVGNYAPVSEEVTAFDLEVIGELLGAKEIPTPGYVHLVREVVDGLGTGAYPLAALVMPAMAFAGVLPPATIAHARSDIRLIARRD
ncbi:MAG: hypothetical protein EBY80_08990 [Actinobacteria bacterium]|nr:hypothetical protein [Actinomycetota bacterium]